MISDIGFILFVACQFQMPILATLVQLAQKTAPRNQLEKTKIRRVEMTVLIKGLEICGKNHSHIAAKNLTGA